VTTWLELDPATPAEADLEVIVDTPSGPVRTEAQVRGGRVTKVAIEPEPALAYALDRPLEVPGHGAFTVDLVLAGGFFVMVDAERHGLALAPGRSGPLADLGMALIDAANAAFEVEHPARPYIDSIDVASFFAQAPGGGKNAVVYGEAHVDRSPCGTGTCARLALEHAKGRLAAGDTFLNRGLLDTCFEGQIAGTTEVGGHPAVRPRIASRAHITGLHHFYAEPEDPFGEGFLLG
jgi:proline racemase